MARRIDYYDDPAAPEPNSVVPAAVALVTRHDGAVLLIRPPTTATGRFPAARWR